MNISELNAPATPPYDYHNHSTIESTKDLFFDRQPTSPDHHHSPASPPRLNNSAFRRVSNMSSASTTTSSMPSPPELLIDSSEDEEDNMCYSMHQSSRKSVPHRSPSNLIDDNQNIVFQIEKNTRPKILSGTGGLLWSLRQRVSLARKQYQHKNRLSAPHPERRVRRAMRIQIPRPQQNQQNNHNDMNTTSFYNDLVLPDPVPVKIIHNTPIMIPTTTTTATTTILAEPTTSNTIATTTVSYESSSSSIKKPKHKKPNTTQTNRKNSTTHASSGRPSRVKGPCQACHETSDGCMRKAFNWPFPTSTIFNDKGKPFVYLCNKCGLRYNKSGGCVCRHCRWVLCKEEKRKAMQLIDQMRRSRPDGRVDPDEDIENFACSPKYWSCGRPWKVGWVLHSQHDAEEDEEMLDHRSSPSLSEATL